MAKKRNVYRKRPRRKKLSIKRLLIVIVLFLAILFGFYKAVATVKHIIFPPKKTTQVKSLTPEEIAREKEKIINIMIDPAKGGINKGMSTKEKNTPEKDINLEIAKNIAADMAKYKDVKVILSREYDEDIPIKDRVKLAEENKIDLFISIRLNAHGSNEEANGADTYYSDPYLTPSIVKVETTTADNIEDSTQNTSSNSSEKADSENNNSSENGTVDAVSETDKNTSVKTREELSKKLATKIQENIISFVKIRDRGIIKNSYDVLKYTKMPAVIVHCGFITNKHDSEILDDKDQLKTLSDGISSGILQFVDENRNGIIKDRINYR